MADATHISHAEPASEAVEAATIFIRTAGYCVLCDRIVERAEKGECPKGHPAAAISGRIVLDEADPVPALPRFNIAAFLIPPLWGPAHRQWAGALFLPIWLFADNAVTAAAVGGAGTRAVAVAIVTLTLLAQAWYAKRANGLAWRRVSGTTGVEEFARRERIWAVAAVAAALAIVGWVASSRLTA